MSFVTSKTAESPVGAIAILSSEASVFANAVGSQGVSANLISSAIVTARLGGGVFANLESEASVSVLGRIDNEPNVFGETDLQSEASLTLNPTQIINGIVQLDSVATVFTNGFTATPAQSILKLFTTIASAASTGTNNVVSARLTADGSIYLISAYQYSENKSDAGVSVNFTLTRLTDRTAIEAASEFKFEVYHNGTWNILFTTGKRAQTGFSLSGQGDQFILSSAAPIAEKLETAPTTNLTIYDPNRITLNQADFVSIFDTDGVEFSHVLTSQPGLTLHGLFQLIFVTKCGFTSFDTNLPDYEIRRADFPITQSFLEGLAGHIGVFQPLIFVEDGTVWIVDGTAEFPAGFPPLRSLLGSEVENAQLTKTKQRIDGFILQFSQNERGFDYIVERVEKLVASEIGFFGDSNYSKTSVSQRFKDYYKSSNPTTPVRSEKIEEITTTERRDGGLLQVVGVETENFVFDSLARVKQTTKSSESYIPGVGLFGASLELVRTEKQKFQYKTDISDIKRQSLFRVTKEVSGLVAIDNENLQLGKPFKQDYSRAFEAGNVKENMVLSFEVIETEEQTFRKTRNGEIQLTRQRFNLLSDPQTVTERSTDIRPGDVSTNSQTSESKDVIVRRAGAVTVNAKYASLSVAELPIDLSIALADRLLSRSEITQGQVTLIGLDLSYRKGTQFELFNREDASLGRFIIEGRQIAGNALGTASQATRMTLEVTGI